LRRARASSTGRPSRPLDAVSGPLLAPRFSARPSPSGEIRVEESMRKLLPLFGVTAIALLLLLPLVLHFGQKAHNRLDIAPIPADAGYVPGMNFGNAAARIIEHELDGLTGWRPNDIVIWGPSVMADNNANRQLGILQALRETVRVFKDDLTKVSNDVYDRNLIEADNLLRNDPYKWAFPSAESRYREAVKRLDAYVAGLRSGASRPINTRNT